MKNYRSSNSPQIPYEVRPASGLNQAYIERGMNAIPRDLVIWGEIWVKFLGTHYRLRRVWLQLADGQRIAIWPGAAPLQEPQADSILIPLEVNGKLLGRLGFAGPYPHPPAPETVAEIHALLPLIIPELSHELERRQSQQTERRITQRLQSSLEVLGDLPEILQEVVILFKAEAALISTSASPVEGQGILARAGLAEIEGREIGNSGAAGTLFQAAIPLPLSGRTEPATLRIFWRHPPAHVFLDEDLLDGIGRQIALALERSFLYREVRQSLQESLYRTHAMVEGWVRVLGLRDHETEEHTRRVSQITMAFVRHLHIPPEQWSAIQNGALLHDIGKLGVPDAILLKPGSLTAPERRMMQMHVIYGHTILSPFTSERLALDIVMYHHERWDGTGYPHGLAGETIPQAARLFSVVDVFDALTSDRPYRTAWLKEQALDYILEQAGRQFDPDLVRLFLEIVNALP